VGLVGRIRPHIGIDSEDRDWIGRAGRLASSASGRICNADDCRPVSHGTDGKTSIVPGANYTGNNPSGPNNTCTVTVTNNGPDTVTSFILDNTPGAGLSLSIAFFPQVVGSVGFYSPFYRIAFLTQPHA